jgi:hypothetical protein
MLSGISISKGTRVGRIKAPAIHSTKKSTDMAIDKLIDALVDILSI